LAARYNRGTVFRAILVVVVSLLSQPLVRRR